MLQHEQEQPLEIPAAQIRVTSEELAQAINALQAGRDEAASSLAGTVPIGQVVEELKLDATPEEVWAQVQKQRLEATEKARAEKAAAEKATAERVADAPHEAFRQAAQEARAAAAQAILAAQAAAQATAQAASVQAGARVYTRPRRRGRWWVPLGICLLIYTGVHGNHLRVHMPGSAQGVISGDSNTLTTSTRGENVEVTGDKDTLVLQGNCPLLTIAGSGNHIRVEGTVGRVIAAGNDNSVVYTQGNEPTLIGAGQGNHIGPSVP